MLNISKNDANRWLGEQSFTVMGFLAESFTVKPVFLLSHYAKPV